MFQLIPTIRGKIDKRVKEIVKERRAEIEARGKQRSPEFYEDLERFHRLLLISAYVQGEIEALPFFKGIPEDRALSIYLNAHHQAHAEANAKIIKTEVEEARAYAIMQTITSASRYAAQRTNSPAAPGC